MIHERRPGRARPGDHCRDRDGASDGFVDRSIGPTRYPFERWDTHDRCALCGCESYMSGDLGSREFWRCFSTGHLGRDPGRGRAEFF